MADNGKNARADLISSARRVLAWSDRQGGPRAGIPEDAAEQLRAALADAEREDCSSGSSAREWEAIGTAPKDGSLVDIYARPRTGKARRFIDCWWTEATGWRNGKADGLRGWTPTHWRRASTPDDIDPIPLASCAE